jgi:hypothetical protein
MQHQTDCSNKRENNKRFHYDYKVGDKILIRKDGILRKAESIWKKEPWTITTTHTRGSGPSLPAKKIFFGRETTFSEAQKTPKKQTDAKQREPFFRPR